MTNCNWHTGLLVFACTAAMVAACGGAPTAEPQTPNPVETPGSASPKDDAKPAEGPTAIPHSIEGREACSTCHTAPGASPVGEAGALPADHAGRADSGCQGCHTSGS
jgi:hypothetical protein